MKKQTKLLLLAVGIVFVGGGLFLVNGFFGNPVSKMLAKNSAENYISENDSERDFVIDNVFYNFKDGYYHAKIKSTSSIDTYFTLSFSKNKLMYNSYEDDVLSGWNTYQRINSEYSEMVERVFRSANFPLVSNIDYGMIELLDSNALDGSNTPSYGVKLGELELDKKYDIKQLAKTTGHIVYYAEDDEISFARASELLMILKESLDHADVPFYAIDFVLEKPRTVSGTPNEDTSSIHTAHFLYSDIYKEGLAERLEKSSTALKEYYEEQDAKMK